MNTVKNEIYIWLINIDNCRTQVEASWTFDAGLSALRRIISFSAFAMCDWKRVECKLRDTNRITIDGIDVKVFHKHIHGSNMDAFVLPRT